VESGAAGQVLPRVQRRHDRLPACERGEPRWGATEGLSSLYTHQPSIKGTSLFRKEVSGIRLNYSRADTQRSEPRDAYPTSPTKSHVVDPFDVMER